jgi:signal peptidase I
VTSRNDERAEAAILERLEQGPSDVVGLAAAVASRLGPAFSGAEGGLHAVLHGLVRADRVEVVDRAADGGALYALPVAAPAEPAGRPWDERMPGADAPPPASPRASRAALRVGSVVRDPGDRGRVVADVLAHLAAIDAAPPGTRSFGAASAARESLRRADRGRARVALVLDANDRLRRFFVHEVPGFLVAAAVFATVWIFLLEPRRIPSRSMEPTLLEGDRIVVWQPGAHDVPERWTVMTFKNAHGDTLVKRVAGLPGDVLSIRAGDLWVGGKIARKPKRVRDALKQETLRAGPFGGEPPKGWTRDPADPSVSRLAGFVPIEEGEIEHAHDVYLDAEVPVGAPWSLAIEFDALLGDSRSLGSVVLRREGAGVALVLARDGREEVVARRDAGPPSGDGEVSLAVVDGFVEARAGDWSVERALDVERDEARLAIRGPVRSLVVSRDVHYTARGEYAIEHDFVVPDGHVFMLGDRSHDSRDSRYRVLGPVALGNLSGRAVWRIWPPLRVGPIR